VLQSSNCCRAVCRCVSFMVILLSLYCCFVVVVLNLCVLAICCRFVAVLLKCGYCVVAVLLSFCTMLEFFSICCRCASSWSGVVSNQLSFFCDRCVVDLLLICCCCVVPEVHLLSICCGAAHDELLIVLHRFVVDFLWHGCRCAIIDLSCA